MCSETPRSDVGASEFLIGHQVGSTTFYLTRLYTWSQHRHQAAEWTLEQMEEMTHIQRPKVRTREA